LGERHHVVLLAMDHDRVRRHRRAFEALHRRRDQHHALGRDAARDAALHEGAEGESREHRRRRFEGGIPLAAVGERSQRVVGLATPVVEAAFALSGAPEIEADRDVAERGEAPGERLRDLVVERAALLRMRMSDQRQAAWRGRVVLRTVEHDLEPPGRARDHRARLGARHERSGVASAPQPGLPASQRR
jgi:hypothetical protein